MATCNNNCGCSSRYGSNTYGATGYSAASYGTYTPCGALNTVSRAPNYPYYTGPCPPAPCNPSGCGGSSCGNNNGNNNTNCDWIPSYPLRPPVWNGCCPNNNNNCQNNNCQNNDCTTPTCPCCCCCCQNQNSVPSTPIVPANPCSRCCPNGNGTAGMAVFTANGPLDIAAGGAVGLAERTQTCGLYRNNSGNIQFCQAGLYLAALTADIPADLAATTTLRLELDGALLDSPQLVIDSTAGGTGPDTYSGHAIFRADEASQLRVISQSALDIDRTTDQPIVTLTLTKLQ